MKECFVEADGLVTAYHRALIRLSIAGEVSDCSDWNCKQKELAMTIHVEKPLQEPRITKLFIGGPRELEQYREEMLDGILDFEVTRGNWPYTYHQRMVTNNQIVFVVCELKRNPSSRRAIISIRTPRDIGSPDPACLQSIQYFIRNGALDCAVLFRSNDAVKATFMNAFALICLQERIANELGVPVGTYTHRANSFHCYEKDFPLLEGYCNRICDADEIYDIAYDYEGDWKDLMDEERIDILRQVEELKKRSSE